MLQAVARMSKPAIAIRAGMSMIKPHAFRQAYEPWFRFLSLSSCSSSVGTTRHATWPSRPAVNVIAAPAVVLIRQQARGIATYNIKEYRKLKESVPDQLLLMQVGNFYELYEKDAITAAEHFPLKVAEGSGQSMVGFPVHRLTTWVPKMAKAGFTLALADQVEDPTKSRRRREVVRVFTPGTPPDFEDTDVIDVPPLMAVAVKDDKAGVCWCSVMTGTLNIETVDKRDIDLIVSRVRPAELLLAPIKDGVQHEGPCRRLGGSHVPLQPNTPEESLHEIGHSPRLTDQYVTVYPSDWDRIDDGLIQHFFPSTHNQFAILQREQSEALSVVLRYLLHCYGPSKHPRLAAPDFSSIVSAPAAEPEEVVKQLPSADASDSSVQVYPQLAQAAAMLPPKPHMTIDLKAQLSLELTTNVQGGKDHTLFAALDNLVTSFGRTELRHRILHPLIDKEQIQHRLNLVSYFRHYERTARYIRAQLQHCSDASRILQVVAVHANEARLFRAMKQLLRTLTSAIEVEDMILATLDDDMTCDSASDDDIQSGTVTKSRSVAKEYVMGAVTPELMELHKVLEKHVSLAEVESAFPDRGANVAVDSLRDQVAQQQAEFERVFDKMDQQLAEHSASYARSSSKKKFAIVEDDDFGLCFDVARAYRSVAEQCKMFPVPYADKRVIFTHAEAQPISKAHRQLQKELFVERMRSMAELRDHILACEDQLRELRERLASLDIAAGAALLAIARGYCRPEIRDRGDSAELHIDLGRHPVLEHLGQHLVPNDCDMRSGQRMWIITGPNMGGKSTFLRQTALIAVMAQMGYFVPASACSLSPLDRVFTRIGASDNLGKEQSTFMVEMDETAAIVRQATPHSLVIMDEVGRGTEHADGLALAAAIVRHLSQSVKCLCLTATHYLQLPLFCEQLDDIACYQADAFHQDDDQLASSTPAQVVYSYRIVPGIATGSFGVETARLAGHPNSVVDYALRMREGLQAIDEDMRPSLVDFASKLNKADQRRG